MRGIPECLFIRPIRGHVLSLSNERPYYGAY